MLDTRAEVNVITCLAAKELDFSIYTDFLLALKAVFRDIQIFNSICKDIEINIRGIVNY